MINIEILYFLFLIRSILDPIICIIFWFWAGWTFGKFYYYDRTFLFCLVLTFDGRALFCLLFSKVYRLINILWRKVNKRLSFLYFWLINIKKLLQLLGNIFGLIFFLISIEFVSSPLLPASDFFLNLLVSFFPISFFFLLNFKFDMILINEI